jgi:hypothetical protein
LVLLDNKVIKVRLELQALKEKKAFKADQVS